MGESRIILGPGLRPLPLIHRAIALRVTEGRMVSNPEKLARSRALLREQTVKIASRLEAAGIEVHRPGEDLTSFGLDTHFVAPAEARWRKLLLLPEVQVIERSRDRALLAAYLDAHPKGKYARMLVVTTGPRCVVEEVGARLDWLHERTRRLPRLLEADGIEVVTRLDEITTNPEAEAHPHANIVVIPTKQLGPDAWRDVLAKLREHFEGRWVRDAGRLRDVAEAVKYTVKYSLALADGAEDEAPQATPETLAETVDALVGTPSDSPGEHLIVRLYHQLHRRHLCQPYGAFREFCATAAENRLKFWRDPRDSKIKVIRIPPMAPPPPADDLEPLPEGEPAEGEKPEPQPKPMENWILSVTMPMALNGVQLEPVALVMGYTAHPTTPEGIAGLKRLRTLAQRLRSDEAIRADEHRDRRQEWEQQNPKSRPPLSSTPAPYLTKGLREYAAALVRRGLPEPDVGPETAPAA